jgi:hypothetical protein
VTAAQEIHKIEFEIPPHRQLEKEAVSLESVYLSSYAFAGTKNYLFPPDRFLNMCFGSVN